MLRADRRLGVALLDVLVATTLLATAGVAFVAHLRTSADAITELATREQEVRYAGTALAALAVLRPDELRARLGVRVHGLLRVEVRELRPGLFSATVRDASSGAEILHTTIAPADGRMNAQ